MMFKSKELQILFSRLDRPDRIYWGIFATIISAGITATIPYIYGRLIDIAISPDSAIKIIIELLLLWFTLSILNNLIGQAIDRLVFVFSMDLVNRVLLDFFRHIINLPMKFHKDKKSGELMRKLGHTIDRLTWVTEDLFQIFPQLLSFLIAITILFYIEWRLALILIITSLIYVIVTIIFAQKSIKGQNKVDAAWEKAYGEAYDALGNIQNVKSTTNENFENKRNLKNYNRAAFLDKEWQKIFLKTAAWQKFISTVSFVAAFGLGIFMLKSGHLTPGKLVMFIGYIGILTAPLSQLAFQYRRFKNAITAFRRAIKIYDIQPEIDFANAITLKQMKGQIIFKNVGFNYKKGQPILENISFEIKPGETVALVGESGVGKTTLTDLIGRYILPSNGRIYIDDIEIRKIKLKSLREQIALVPQEIVLFNDTIKNNIRYGNLRATDEKIIEATKIANAYEFIDKFPNKFEQVVGERGIKLSTGQKQRVAIARAVIREPKIIILDEATSALDSSSEKLVQEALEKVVQGRTTLIIAHRLSTIQRADKIIVLEKGQIAEMGNHEELMKNPQGIYRNFWELQTAIKKLKPDGKND